MGHRTKFNKLVRDKIPEYIIKKGGNPMTHRADEKEYWQKLKKKLLEEVGEFNENENIDEFADIQEVLDAIAEYKKFKHSDIKFTKENKAIERGKFQDRIILDEA